MRVLSKFVMIGILNTIFFYLMYAFLIYLGLHYSLATFFATCIGMFFSFKTFGKFVFDNDKNNLLLKFIFVTIFNYLLNIFIIYQCKLFGYNNYNAGLIAVMLVACSSFLFNKYYVFKKVN